ncbi:MAG: bacteriohemerythrin [Magnetococcales bacterium]|nr:bacteriohemerythrin [Magnetococcales bacterium]
MDLHQSADALKSASVKDRPVNLAVVALVSLIVAILVTVVLFSFYRTWLFSERQENLVDQVQHQAREMQLITFHGKISGTAELLGMAVGEIKESALGNLPPDAPETLNILRMVVQEFGSDNVFVLNKAGVIVAYLSSKGRSGTGKNISFRPYYIKGIAGESNLYAAVGTTSDERGLYHAAPIYRERSRASEVIGVIVVKIGLQAVDRFLANWHGPAMLMTPERVVFATNRSEFQFRFDVAEGDRLSQPNWLDRFGNFKLGKGITPFPFDMRDNRFIWQGEEYEYRTSALQWNDPRGPWHLLLAENRESWFPQHYAAWIAGLLFVSIMALEWMLIFYWLVRVNRQQILIAKETSRLQSQAMLEKLDDAMQQVHDSIQYASRIQRSILPKPEWFDAAFSDYFMLWNPRDTVGGDIYWYRNWGAGTLIIMGDCTGHGIPGAFVTLVANGALDQAYLETPHGDPGFLLQRMHQLLQTTLGQDLPAEEGSNDGIELGVCYLDGHGQTLIYAGARFDLFIVRHGQVERIKGTKAGLGYRSTPYNLHINNHEVRLQGNESFYMTSDGLIDQVGAEKRCGFGVKRFQNLIAELADEPMAQQKIRIEQTLAAWQGSEERRDDVSVIGFKVRSEGSVTHQTGQDAGAIPLLDYKLIDDDHKKLYGIVDQLGLAVVRGEDRSRILALMEELADYTKWHFRHEERLMTMYQYPDQQLHKYAHARLIEQVVQIIQDLENGVGDLSVQIVQIMQDWLKQHIQGDDRDFTTFLIGQGVSGDQEPSEISATPFVERFFALDETLLVGYTPIDDDHRKLIEIMNQLHASWTRTDACEEIIRQINALVNYTLWHFRHEERLMQQHDYPRLAQHKEAHQDLMIQVRAVKHKVIREDVTASQELNLMLRNWLIEHIHKMDKDLSRYLLAVAK